MPIYVNFDPGEVKAIVIGILLFFEALIAPTLVILQQGEIPSTIQCITILLTASMQLVTYFLAFLGWKKEE